MGVDFKRGRKQPSGSYGRTYHKFIFIIPHANILHLSQKRKSIKVLEEGKIKFPKGNSKNIITSMPFNKALFTYVYYLATKIKLTI